LPPASRAAAAHTGLRDELAVHLTDAILQVAIREVNLHTDMLVAMYPKGPVVPNVRAEQAAAKALVELTDEQFIDAGSVQPSG
jgi:hypothetical protein